MEGGVVFSQTEVLAESILSLLSPPPSWHEDTGGSHIRVSVNLANTGDPTLKPLHTQLWAHSNLFQWLFHVGGLSWLMLRLF